MIPRLNGVLAGAAALLLALAGSACASPGQLVTPVGKDGASGATVANPLPVECESGCSGGGGGGGLILGWDGSANQKLGATLNGSAYQLDIEALAGSNLANMLGGPTPIGGNLIGFVSNDPCAQAAKLTADFESASSGGNLITGTAAKQTYICSISVRVSTLTNLSLCEATSTACSGGTPAGVWMNPGVTAANGGAVGASATAPGGSVDGTGGYTVARTATAGQNVDVLFTTTNTPQVNLHVTYVQQGFWLLGLLGYRRRTPARANS